MKLTTTRLHLPTTPRAHWYDLPTPVAAAICTAALIAIAALVGRIQSPPAVEMPAPGLPVIVIQKEPAPAQQVAVQLPAAAPARQVVAFAAPDGDVLGPIPWSGESPILGRFGDDWIMTSWEQGNVWVRVSELGGSLADLAPAAPQLQPAYAPQTDEYAAPTPEPGEYQIAAQPAAGDFYAPPDTPIEERQKLIGTDPNALACGGSPLCGGMTNAEAQAALDRERNTQAHLANEHAQPTEPPSAGVLFQQTEVQKALQAEAWRQEHCVIATDPATCR